MNEFQLKYGTNPNQKPARIYMADGSDLPVQILNGRPGYINFLDAFNSWQLVRDLCEEYHAQGVLYEQLKFCEYWGYERALASHVITHDYGIPSVAVDRQNATGGNGQLRTRVQAFVESLEIKQLQAQRGGM